MMLAPLVLVPLIFAASIESVAPINVSILASKPGQAVLAGEILDSNFRLRPELTGAEIISILNNNGFILLEKRGSLYIYADSQIPELGNRINALSALSAIETIRPFEAISFRSIAPDKQRAILSYVDFFSTLVTSEGNPHFKVNIRLNCDTGAGPGATHLPLGELLPTQPSGSAEMTRSYREDVKLLDNPFFSKSHPKLGSQRTAFPPPVPFPTAPLLIHLAVPSANAPGNHLSHATLNKWTADAYLKFVFELNEQCRTALERYYTRNENLLYLNQWGVKTDYAYTFAELPAEVQKRIRGALLLGSGSAGDAVKEQNYLRSINLTFRLEADISVAVDTGQGAAIRSVALLGSHPLTPP
ncbi:hypothetical protein QM565_13040 [Geitlerinema splendidum]|nr:hypothetical protein [Geitlerinema splendidum]